MMKIDGKLHLGFNKEDQLGVIKNDTYFWGAVIRGLRNAPKLSFEYDRFSYTEIFNRPSYKVVNGIRMNLTDENIREIRELAKNWKQEEDQEGYDLSKIYISPDGKTSMTAQEFIDNNRK